MDGWPPEVLTPTLADLLTRSSRALTDALGRLVEVQQELRSIVEISPRRPLSEAEMGKYYALTREERRAHNRYNAARDWYDGVRRRIRQRAGRLERDG
jgi:hypothetical protein